MVLARWQGTIVDEAGNVQDGATVTVRREAAGSPLATLFSDRAGATPTGNPVTADGDGYAAFHVAGGAYRITAAKAGFTREWRYVAIGLAGETDGANAGSPMVFDDGVNDADPGAGNFRFNNSTPALATKMFISQTSPLGADLAAWLATWDDGGDSADRGTLVVQTETALLIARVTGTVTDDGAYFDVPITVLVATDADTFVPTVRHGVTFTRSGVDGADGADATGDVVGPASAVNNRLVAFDGTTGKLIKDSGKTIDTVAAGKQTVYIPAGSMIRQTTNPPATLASTELATNDIMLEYLGFDATTAENAQFSFPAPKSMDESAGVTFRVLWSHPATTVNFGVAWQLQGLGVGDDDAMDAAMGTGVVVTDTGGTTDDLYRTAESSAVTVANLAEGDLMFFRISRQPSNGSDTMAVDARLIGVEVFYTTNANTDA